MTAIEQQFYNAVISACRKVNNRDKWEERTWQLYAMNLSDGQPPSVAIEEAKKAVQVFRDSFRKD